MTLELPGGAATGDALSDDWGALSPRLLAIAMRVVRRREVAEEVVSTTVLEMLERMAGGEEIRDHAAYLARGVRFRAIDVVRSRDGQAVVGTEVADSALQSIADDRLGAMAVDDVDALSPVREAFGALSTRHRDVLQRTIVDGEAVQDVARDWGMAPNSVSVLALRARRALHAELKVVLMERAGGECARLARTRDRTAVRHVAGCRHCREVRGGRGLGGWMLGVVPLLLGSSAVLAAPANGAHAAMQVLVAKPLLALGAAGATAAAVALVVVASSSLPAVQGFAAAPPPAAAPASTDGTDDVDAAGVPSPTPSAQAADESAAPGDAGAVGIDATTAPAPSDGSQPTATTPGASQQPAPTPTTPTTPVAAPTPAPASEPAPTQPDALPPPSATPAPPAPRTPPAPPLPPPPIPVVPPLLDAPIAFAQWVASGLVGHGTVTISGLVVGQQYTVQVSGLGVLRPQVDAQSPTGLSCGLSAILDGAATCLATSTSATLSFTTVLGAVTCGGSGTLRVAALDATVQRPLSATLPQSPCLL